MSRSVVRALSLERDDDDAIIFSPRTERRRARAQTATCAPAGAAARQLETQRRFGEGDVERLRERRERGRDAAEVRPGQPDAEQSVDAAATSRVSASRLCVHALGEQPQQVAARRITVESRLSCMLAR
jgi:hypothetical protein